MQRISPPDARIRHLGELLSPRAEIAIRVVSEGVPEQPTEDLTADPALALEQERMRVFESAWNEGYASGMAEAGARIEERGSKAEQEWRSRYEQQTERLKTETAALVSLRESLSLAITRLEQQAEPLIIEIVFAAVRRIIGAALRDESLALALCREALEEYPLRPVVLRVARADLDAAKAAMASEDIRVEADQALRAGQCRLESAKGLYEVSVEQRLQAFQSALIGVSDEAGDAA